MNKFKAFVLLIAVVFTTSQLMAQVETSSQDKSKKTEKNTGTKTEKQVPKIKSSKDAPGTGTNGQTGNTQKAKGTKVKAGTGAMSSEKSNFQTGKMFDATGNLIYYIDQLGWIRNPKNRALAQYNENGEVIRNRKIFGRVDNGIFYDRSGHVLAHIEQNGKVTDAQGNLLGNIREDGTVMNKGNNKIGSAPGVDKNVTAIIFFLMDQGNKNSNRFSLKK